mgnify:CR=1 FL=1
MSRSKLKESLRKREILFGGWISYDHRAIAETFALTGFDFISIDMEHAPISIESAQNIISIAQSKKVPCLPRPVSHSNDFFKPLLDSGADGLIVQMVETVEEVKKISNHLKYPPIGKRTFGINRAQEYGLNFKNYIENWNKESILIVQIESKKGIENIESIVSHPLVDGVMIGPYDLSGSYGFPGDIKNHIVIDACSKVSAMCKKYNKSCGTQISETTQDNVNEALKLGYNFIILGSDLFVFSNWSKKMSYMIKEFK